MGDLKIGGVYYGMNVQKAMEEAHTIIVESVEEVFKDDVTEAIVKTAIDEYEYCFLKLLGEHK